MTSSTSPGTKQFRTRQSGSRRSLALVLVGLLGFLGLPVLSASRAEAGPAWNRAAPLTLARSEHSATTFSQRLSSVVKADGILVAGGYDAAGPTASAEVFNPTARDATWAPIASMAVARARHSAAALGGNASPGTGSNGEVLVAGGVGAAGPLASTERYNPATGAWKPAAPLTTARSEHSATALLTGKVLVVGGSGPAGPTASVELYDPSTPAGVGSWAPTASLSVARTNHTATLLANGKVLVSGGSAPSGPVASAELYDPATGLWSAAGSMSSARANHAATVLANGKVLVSGGSAPSGPVASADLYDPATGAWSPTGSMSNPRANHSAAVTRNGKLVVAGGSGARGLTATAELYNPSTGTWSPTGPLATARANHTAMVFSDVDGVTRTVVAGGSGPAGPLASSEQFEEDAWSRSGDLASPRTNHSATLLADGKVLVAGGSGSGGLLASAEVYDPVAATWSQTGAMVSSRTNHSATMLPNGLVLVAGGSGPGGPLATAELYDPSTATWRPTGPLTTPRHLHSATLLATGKVLVAGGRTVLKDGNTPESNDIVDSAEVYDPATGLWSATGSLHGRRHSHSATLLTNGNVLVAAGSVFPATAELYDPVATDPTTGRQGAWSPTASLRSTARIGHSATLLNTGKVLVAGGSGNPATAELYDPASRTWSATASLAAAHNYHSATLLPDGKVLVAGSTTSGAGGVVPPVEVYDPASATWRTTASFITGRSSHTATLLANATVVVAGGSSQLRAAGNTGATDPLATTEVYDATSFLPGFLRATTSPAVPSQIIVDGVARDSWGLTWMKMAAGTHEVCFTDVAGFDTPPCQAVRVHPGRTTTFTGAFVPRGLLRVITTPAVPSTISVDGVPRNDWGMWTDLSPGPHTVCFGKVADFATPPCQTVVVAAGASTVVNGTFAPLPGAPGPSGHGWLRAITEQALPSQVVIDGVARDSWGTWPKLSPGRYSVCFTDVVGFDTPPCQSAEVRAGQTTTIVGTFAPRGFLRVITEPAVPATISVDGVARNDWGMWTDLATGAHTVCFGEVPGYTAPPCRGTTLTAGATTTLTGAYTRKA